MSTLALVDIAVPVDQNIIRTEEEKVEKAESSVWNQKDSWSLESHHNTYRDWWFGVPEFTGSVQLSAILGTQMVEQRINSEV